MERDTALMVVIGIALLVVAFQTVQLVGLTNNIKTTGLATAQPLQTGSSDPAYDQMMQEMHPDQVAQGAGSQSIGGC